MGGSLKPLGGVAPQPRPAPPLARALPSPAPLRSRVPSGAEKRREGAGPGDLLHPRAETGGMFPAQEEADRTVFVGNLEARVREEILYELFLQVSSAGGGGGAGSVEPEAQPEGRGAPGPSEARPPSRGILCPGL